MKASWMPTRIIRKALGVGLALTLGACGMWQSVKDGTVDATHAVFETKVKQMNLAITARAALNRNADGVSLPVVLRIYQLKDDKPFVTATYAQLLSDTDVLKAVTLWSRAVTLGPGRTLKVSEPIGDEAKYVGVAAFFIDNSRAEWSVLIPKAQWKKVGLVKLVVMDGSLEIDAAPQ